MVEEFAIGLVLALAASGTTELNAAIFKADQEGRPLVFGILGLVSLAIFIGLVRVSRIRPGAIGATVAIVAYFVISWATGLGYARMLARQFETGWQQGREEATRAKHAE